MSANAEVVTFPAGGDLARPDVKERTAGVGVASAIVLPEPESLILRFRKAEIMIHWSIAAPFMLCYASGILLKLFFNLSPGAETVTREVLRWLHRIGGAGLIVLPTASAIWNRKEFSVHLYNIKKAWSWTIADVKWLMLMGLAALSSRIHLPEQHKFNAAEKLNFMMVMCTYPVFIATGLALLLPGTWFVSFVIHVAVALVVTPLVLGHIYMAVVNPSTRVGLPGMVTGRVDRQWAKHHYRRWYREHFETEEALLTVPDEARTALLAPAHLRCAACGVEHDVASWLTVLDSVVNNRPITCPVCGADAETISVVASPGEAEPILRGLEQAGVSALLSSATPELAIPHAAMGAAHSPLRDVRPPQSA